MSKSNPTVVRVCENFTIRKIVLKDSAIRYFKGDYKERTLPEFKIRPTVTLGKIGKEIGKDSTSEVYRFLDRSNNNQVILTTNHSLYKYALEENKESRGLLNKPILKCKYCKRTILKSPIGLPISMEPEGDKLLFSVIDSFCDFGCALSYLKRRLMESRLYKGPLYMNSEQMLYCMYYRMYPDRIGQSICEKPDWDLLRENGGPLSNEEFDSNNSNYISIPSIVILPSKRQYTKLNLK